MLSRRPRPSRPPVVCPVPRCGRPFASPPPAIGPPASRPRPTPALSPPDPPAPFPALCDSAPPPLRQRPSAVAPVSRTRRAPWSFPLDRCEAPPVLSRSGRPTFPPLSFAPLVLAPASRCDPVPRPRSFQAPSPARRQRSFRPPAVCPVPRCGRPLASPPPAIGPLASRPRPAPVPSPPDPPAAFPAPCGSARRRLPPLAPDPPGLSPALRSDFARRPVASRSRPNTPPPLRRRPTTVAPASRNRPAPDLWPPDLCAAPPVLSRLGLRPFPPPAPVSLSPARVFPDVPVPFPTLFPILEPAPPLAPVRIVPARPIWPGRPAPASMPLSHPAVGLGRSPIDFWPAPASRFAPGPRPIPWSAAGPRLGRP